MPFIFGRHRKPAPPQNENTERYYEMTCPYCLEKFEIWEMPFRAVTSAGATATSQKTAPSPETRNPRRVSSRRVTSGQSEEESAAEEVAIPVNAAANTANLGYFPPEDDLTYKAFATKVNIDDPVTVPGKVLTLYRPKGDDGKEGAFDGSDIKEVKIRGSEEWTPVSLDTAAQLYHKAIVRVKDKFGNETATRLCPHCHNTMIDDACLHPNYTIMFLGNTNSGKTVYKIRLLYELAKRGLLNGKLTTNRIVTNGQVDGIDITSIENLHTKTFQNAYINGGNIAPITHIKFINPITFPVMRNGETAALVTFYDFPGEAIRMKRDDQAHVWFMQQIEKRMNNLDGIIFLLDSSSIDVIRDALPPEYLVVAGGDDDQAEDNKKAGQKNNEEDRKEAAAISPHEILAGFQNNFITAEMQNRIPVPICYTFSKSDLLEKVIREFRADPSIAPALYNSIDNLADPPVCVTNWREQGLADELRRMRANGTFKQNMWNRYRSDYIEKRSKEHTRVDMANILRSHEELTALLGDELGTVMEVSPKGLLFAVSAVGLPVTTNQAIPRADPLRLTEPLEYLLWQMGLVDCDEDLTDSDRRFLKQLKTGKKN